jgi:hypothetical protein
VEVSIKVLNGAGLISERMGRRDVELKTRSAHDLRLIGEAEDIGDECGAALYRCLIPLSYPSQIGALLGLSCLAAKINWKINSRT